MLVCVAGGGKGRKGVWRGQEGRSWATVARGARRKERRSELVGQVCVCLAIKDRQVQRAEQV